MTVEDLQPGDVIAYKNGNSTSGQHWVVVWKIVDGQIYVAEGNSDNHCKVHFGPAMEQDLILSRMQVHSRCTRVKAETEQLPDPSESISASNYLKDYAQKVTAINKVAITKDGDTVTAWKLPWTNKSSDNLRLGTISGRVTLTKEIINHVGNGWYEYKDQKGTVGYVPDEDVMLVPDRTITLDPNGGSCDTKEIVVLDGINKLNLPTPIRNGYIFDGWYTEKTGGMLIDPAKTYTIGQDLTFYAHWTRSTNFTKPYYSKVDSGTPTEDNTVIIATGKNPDGITLVKGGFYLRKQGDSAVIHKYDNIVGDWQTAETIPCSHDLKNEYKITTLEPGTVYEFRLYLEDETGAKFYSCEENNWHTFKTAGYAPGNPDASISAEEYLTHYAEKVTSINQKATTVGGSSITTWKLPWTNTKDGVQDNNLKLGAVSGEVTLIREVINHSGNLWYEYETGTDTRGFVYSTDVILETDVTTEKVVESGNCGADGDNVTYTLTAQGVLTIIGNGKMADYEQNSPFYKNEDITRVMIAEGVTHIGDYAFYLCENLITVSISNTVTTIGNNAFGSCDSLTTLDIPESVTSMGYGVFLSCDNLREVILPEGITTIRNQAFAYCSSLTSVNIPPNVTSIEHRAFNFCHGLTSITFPDGLIAIDSFAFDDCDNLTTVTFPVSIATIGQAAFSRCDKLSDVYYSGSKNDWSEISIDKTDNDCLINAIIHYADENSIAVSYDVNAALTYAATNYTNYPTQGNGRCSEFVMDCLWMGGLKDVYGSQGAEATTLSDAKSGKNKDTGTLYRYLKGKGFEVEYYYADEEKTKLATIQGQGSDNSWSTTMRRTGVAQPGDCIFYFGEDESNPQHFVICSENGGNSNYDQVYSVTPEFHNFVSYYGPGTGNVRYIAVFHLSGEPDNAYSCSFESGINGSAGSMDSLYVVSGKTFTMPQSGFSYPGFEVAGWNLKRSDGLWLTYEDTFASEEDATSQGYYIFHSGYQYTFEETWADGEDCSFTFYPIWRESESDGATEEGLRSELANGKTKIRLEGSVTLDKDLVIPAGTTLTICSGKTLIVPQDVKITNNGEITVGVSTDSSKSFLKVKGTCENNGDISVRNGGMENSGSLNNNGEIAAYGSSYSQAVVLNDGTITNNGSIWISGEQDGSLDAQFSGGGIYHQTERGSFTQQYGYVTGVQPSDMSVTICARNTEEIQQLLSAGYKNVQIWVLNDLTLTQNITFPSNTAFIFNGRTLTIPEGIRMTVDGAYPCELSAESSAATVNVQGELYCDGDYGWVDMWDGIMNISGKLVVNSGIVGGRLIVLDGGTLINNGNIGNYGQPVNLTMSEMAIFMNNGYIAGENEKNNSTDVSVAGTSYSYEGRPDLTLSEAADILKYNGIAVDDISVIWQAGLLRPEDGEEATITVNNHDGTWYLLGYGNDWGLAGICYEPTYDLWLGDRWLYNYAVVLGTEIKPNWIVSPISILTEDNAVINATWNNPLCTTMKKVGCLLGTTQDMLQGYGHKDISGYEATAQMTFSYDLKNDCGISLDSGTTYYYQFYIESSTGLLYFSDVCSFTTAGDTIINDYEYWITEDMTLTNNLLVSEESSVYISEGVTVTVPSGVELNIQGYMDVYGNLIFEDGSILTITDEYWRCLSIWTGKMNATGADISGVPDGSIEVLLNSTSEVIGIPNEMLWASVYVNNTQDINAALELAPDYKFLLMVVDTSFTLTNSITIPENAELFIWQRDAEAQLPTVTVPGGITVTNNGSLVLDSGYFIAEQNGKLINNNYAEVMSAGNLIIYGELQQNGEFIGNYHDNTMPQPESETKVEINYSFADADIPDELGSNPKFDTVGEIELEMKQLLEEIGVQQERSVLYDAVLMHKDEAGNWKEADETHFPIVNGERKLAVTLSVPEETDPENYKYYVVHMFSSGSFGKTPGDMEIFEDIIAVSDGKGGYCVTVEVTGLSPFLVGAERKTIDHQHCYNEVVTKPTCTETGFTTYTCTCGDSYVDNYVEALGHSYEDGSCTVCGEADPDYSTAVKIASGWSGDLTWVLTDDGVLTFSGTGAMKNYGYKSEMPWYKYIDQITSVVINEGVTRIGDYAFYGMTKLETIDIADTVTYIGDFSFKGSTALDGVVLPSGLSNLGTSAFYGCTGLTAIEIPASLYTVKPYAFKNCSSLAEVTFHEGNLMKLSDGSFYGTALTEVEFPKCLDIIDVYCFKNCFDLASITIPEGDLTQIREAVFYATAIPSITIPEGVTKVGPYAFKNCVNLKSVNLPTTLTSVGEASFYACTGLQGITIPDAVTSIGDYAFRKCAAMTEVNLGRELTDIGLCAFYGCSGLTNLEIPDKVTTIQGYAFKGCTGLTDVKLGSSVETLGESAFHTCTALKTLELPNTLKTIGDYCFSGSYNLWQLTFTGNAPSIGSGAFKSLAATACYPANDSTWTSDVMQNYGGSITWKAVDENGNVVITASEAAAVEETEAAEKTQTEKAAA